MKCLKQKLWDNSPQFLKQLDGIGNAFCAALTRGGITSFKKLEEANPRRIEAVSPNSCHSSKKLVGRKPPFGNKLKELVCAIPRFSLKLIQVKSIRFNIHYSTVKII